MDHFYFKFGQENQEQMKFKDFFFFYLCEILYFGKLGTLHGSLTMRGFNHCRSHCTWGFCIWSWFCKIIFKCPFYQFCNRGISSHCLRWKAFFKY